MGFQSRRASIHHVHPRGLSPTCRSDPTALQVQKPQSRTLVIPLRGRRQPLGPRCTWGSETKASHDWCVLLRVLGLCGQLPRKNRVLTMQQTHLNLFYSRHCLRPHDFRADLSHRVLCDRVATGSVSLYVNASFLAGDTARNPHKHGHKVVPVGEVGCGDHVHHQVVTTGPPQSTFLLGCLCP